MLVSPVAPDETYNQQMWSYYHSVSSKILAGDIDTYLQLIYEVNPLDDLLMYGSNYEFGTDDAKKIEVEFNVDVNALPPEWDMRVFILRHTICAHTQRWRMQCAK